MPVSPARAAAFDILLRVESEDSYASELLHSSQYQKLSSQDHGLATELVMGVIRWQSSLDKQITYASEQKLQRLDVEVLIALRLAAYQLFFLDRVPARAAVNESVELVKRSRKRSAMPFTNAVLRRLSASVAEHKHEFPSTESEGPMRLADSSAHPLWLVERWARQYGAPIARNICEHDQHVPETSIRLTDPLVEAELKKEGIELYPGKLLATARRVQSRDLTSGDLTKTAAFRKGLVSIQDEASQLVALFVGRGNMILDCCAAPGGKTRILAERNPGANIIAVDLHPHRARLLRRLVPAKNVYVVAGDVVHLPTNALFDRVLVDAPCSGTGTLSRNPEIKWRLKPEDLTDLQGRQRAILQSAMKHVLPGGRLVYSTCSLEHEENSDVVEIALSADDSFRTVNSREVLDELQSEGELTLGDGSLASLISGPYLRTLPGVHPCDGFFAAVLEKN